MKKLLKGALTLAIATIVGIPQLQAAVPNWGWSTTTESEADTYDANQSDGLSYDIEIKNAIFQCVTFKEQEINEKIKQNIISSNEQEGN